MRLPVVLFCLLFASATVAGEDAVIRLSEPVAVTEDYEDFGAAIENGSDALSLASVLEDAEAYLDKTILVKTRISQVCQKKGCFFIAKDGDKLIRVAFRDYGFYVPTDVAGRQVTLLGQLVTRERSAEEIAHYLEDAPGAGLSAGTAYEIVADAVRVPRKPAGS